MCKKSKDRFSQFVSVDFNVKCELCEVNCKSQKCLIRHTDKVCVKIEKCIYCKILKQDIILVV